MHNFESRRYIQLNLHNKTATGDEFFSNLFHCWNWKPASFIKKMPIVELEAFAHKFQY